MLDSTCAEIATAVLRLASTHPRESTNPNDGRNPDGLEEYFCNSFFPALMEDLALAAPADRDEIAAVALMVMLASPLAGAPPASLREEFLLHIGVGVCHAAAEKRCCMIVQLGLAYGCGWKRTARSGQRRWDELWAGAVQEMVNLTHMFLTKAYRLLAANVRGFPEIPRGLDSWEVVKSDALYIAMLFSKRPVGPDAPLYHKFQSIVFWNPHLGNLYGWLKGAVFGSQSGSTAAGKFRGGLLFDVLRERGHEIGIETVDVGKVAFQSCRKHGPEKEYEGGCCEVCGSRSIITFDVFLVVPGVYLPKYFWRCPDSVPAHYFDYAISSCPVCKIPHGGKPTVLLVQKKFVEGDEIPNAVSEDGTT